MSQVKADTITDLAGTGAPSLPFGVKAALTGASFTGTDTTAVAHTTERRLGQAGSEDWDTHGALSSGNFTVPVGFSGYWEMSGGCSFSATSDANSVSIRFKVNAVVIRTVAIALDPTSSESTPINGLVTVAAAAGDVLSMHVYQDNAGTAARNMEASFGAHSALQFIQFRFQGI